MQTVPTLRSEEVVIQAPMSFTGSAKRIWRITRQTSGAMKALAVAVALTLVFLAWSVVLCWYVLFGVLLVPYRLIRRGERKRKRDELRHRELIAASDASKELARVG